MGSELLLRLFLAACGVALLWVAAGALSGRRLVLGPDGIRRPELSDLERFLAPLGRYSLRSKEGSRERLMKDLEFARIGWFVPETWSGLTWASGPLAFFGATGLFSTLGANPGLAIFGGAISGAMGFFYPRFYLSSRLAARRRLIRREALPFISQYARTGTVIRDTTAIFEELEEIAARDRAARIADAPVRRKELRRGSGQYASDLWVGLSIMMAEQSAGIYRGDATADDPDPLMRFAAFVDDPDFSTFIDRVRQARSQDRHINPDQLDALVDSIAQRRVSEAKASAATLVAKATFILVAFNMPLLFGAILFPIIFGVISGGV